MESLEERYESLINQKDVEIVCLTQQLNLIDRQLQEFEVKCEVLLNEVKRLKDQYESTESE